MCIPDSLSSSSLIAMIVVAIKIMMVAIVPMMVTMANGLPVDGDHNKC